MNSVEERETAARWEAAIQPKMENKASDGAYFTRPAAADIACRLTLDVLEENPPKHLAFNDAGKTDWTSPQTWRGLKTLDPAVGSGILPAALTFMAFVHLVCAFVGFQANAANSA